MSESLDLDQDPVFDKSIILDSIQLTDPILIDNKLGDTNKGVPGRLLERGGCSTTLFISQVFT